MHISIISRGESGWHAKDIKRAAKKKGVKITFHRIYDVNDIERIKKELGDVIIWRAGNVGHVGRSIVMKLLKDRVVINMGIAMNPYLPQKLFQQKLVERTNGIEGIATYHFQSKEDLKAAIKDGRLKFPFIEKPSFGCMGNGVELIKNMKEVNKLKPAKDIIYQNFIKNSGDFRVFILGGRVAGVVKRIGQEGSHLNNFSKGGSVHEVEDKDVLQIVSKIGMRAAILFDLALTGVDVIYDEDDKVYRFNEVNTAPEWELHEIYKQGIADQIVDYCKEMHARKTKATVKLVHDYYNGADTSLLNKTIHFYTRMYLWTGKKMYLKKLKEHEGDYLGKGEAGFRNLIDGIMARKRVKATRGLALLRQPYFNKYKNLSLYLATFYKCLFAYTAYGRDYRVTLREMLGDENLLSIGRKLREDKKALAILSTHALNYLYLLEFIFDGKKGTKVDPKIFMNLEETYKKVNKKYRVKLEAYLYTHAIINETHFYSRAIKRNKTIYKEMVKRLEKLIFENFMSISLDNKLEFLVSAAMVEQDVSWRHLIDQEADASLSPLGNFLIDTHNTSSIDPMPHFFRGEHRNVLYLMSRMPWQHAKKG